MTMEKEARPVELPDAEIARLVVARTFLEELEDCLTQQHFGHHIQDRDGRLAERFTRRFEFVDQHVPVAWQNAAFMAETSVPASFQAKLADPKNADHNRQHLAHTGNNVIIGAAYDLYLPAFSQTDLIDSANVLMFGAFDHDHLQIDRKIKEGHDYLGALFNKGLMRLARVKYGLPYTERQEDLLSFAVYWHSYPEKMTDELPSAKQLLNTYGETFGLKDPTSLLFWLSHELNLRGIDLGTLDCHLTRSDMFLARWLNSRLTAGDKRASYVPSLLSLLRTMGTGNKPFIDSDFIGRPLSYFEANMRAENTVSRTFYEDRRDLRAIGFSAFEINWLKVNQMKKLDYLVKIAAVLSDGGGDLITAKFSKYAAEVIYESYREKTLVQGERAYLLAQIPWLMLNSDFSSLLNSFSPELVQTLQTIVFDYRETLKLMKNKGKELRQFLSEKHWTADRFIGWFSGLVEEMKASNQLKVVGRHEQTPENLPVYCVSLSVVN